MARASVIVRAKNEARTIERTFSALRSQTVEPEIIVVDSGSTDGTMAIARRWCDRLIEMPAASFTYGAALNLGAEAASAPFHFALSAHCAPDRPDWIELSLAHYQRADVAATNGRYAGGRPFDGVFYQDLAHARSDPFWGLSNHASSWRASLWREFPFDEELDYAEDREWAFRVLEAGWVIAFDPDLFVDLSHVWRNGYVEYYTRQKRAARAVRSFADVPAYGARELVKDWWDEPLDPRPPWRRRLNPLRAVGLLGKFRGHHAPVRRARIARASPASEQRLDGPRRESVQLVAGDRETKPGAVLERAGEHAGDHAHPERPQPQPSDDVTRAEVLHRET